ncbi:unnamed protein product [Rotaria sordida]|uniref:HTH CENPB-type domain-containing protein n=1 Tax=Rotaria sordida TaxID=392033 RepID=A0A816AX54_9BILA|nr:unnamed protein product [Rotaria sordida]CAF1600366.1 unnamed protein product [Rotaria sordida]
MAPRVDLPLLKKVELIKDYDRQFSQRDLATKYKISTGAVCNILKRKQEYLDDFESNQCHEVRRKIKNNLRRKIDEETYSWFVAQRAKNITLSGPTIQEKARQIAAEFSGNVIFKASNDWFEKFRSRHNISYRAICGESASVNPVTTNEWKNRLPLIIDGYDRSNIFNADETSLFFKALPEKSFVLNKEDCKGRKRSKERFTILLCTNWSGDEKLKPLVIGKSLKPRCFKHVNIQNLPVEWAANRTAWMNATLFQNWLNNLNFNMKKQNRRILLFIDNAPCHPTHIQLSNVKLQFFLLIQHHCSTVQTTSDITITALDTVCWIDSAWKSVTKSTIQNTFTAAGFKQQQIDPLPCIIPPDTNNGASSTSNELLLMDFGMNEETKVLDNLLKHVVTSGSTMNANEFINIDSHAPTFNEWNDDSERLVTFDNIIQSNELDDDEEKIDEETPPKLCETIEMVRRLRLFSITQSPQLHQAIIGIESMLTDIYLDSKTSVQSTLDSYFKKLSYVL